jgi:hypothetical protein
VFNINIMPPKKNGRRSNKTSRKASVPSAVSEYQANTAENRAALRMVKASKGPNNKYINSLYTFVNGVNITNTSPLTSCLNGVAQGTSENTRVGRLCKMKWLDLDMNVNAINGSITTQNVPSYRAYIVVETTALGSQIQPAQFFVDSTVFEPMSQRDRTNRNASRYVVLWDSKPQMLCTASATGSGTQNSMAAGPPVRWHSLHIPLDFDVDYSRGNAGTYADIDTNALHLLVVTDDATSNHIYVDAAYTLCFNDDS